MKILIVEDDPSQRELIRRQLHKVALEIYEAETIEEAKAQMPVDLILADWHLPDGTAKDLANHGVPVIVLSGYDHPPDGSTWSGMWLRKPLYIKDLYEKILTAIARAGENRPDPLR